METSLNYSIKLILVLLTIVLIYYKWASGYWKRRGIPCEQNPFQTLITVIKQKEPLFVLTKKIYWRMRKLRVKHCGFYLFGKPIWIPTDPDLIRDIFINDSSYFINHGMYFNVRDDPMTSNIFLIEDEKWKQTRAALSSLFTPGKLKTTFHLMQKSVENIERVVGKAAKEGETIDLKDYTQRFFIDVIAAYVIGLNLDTFKHPESDYRKYGKQAIELSVLQSLKFLISLTVPRKWLRAVRFKLNMPQIEKFFMEQIKGIMDYRLKHSIKGNDFLELFMELEHSGKTLDTEEGPVEFRFSTDNIVANVFTFFVAGFESSSVTTTFALVELALNHGIQDKVRDEVRNVLKEHDGQLSYEAVTKMQYLEQVVKGELVSRFEFKFL